MVLGIPTIICIQKLPILSLGHELCGPPNRTCFSEAARYGAFFTYCFLILTHVHHLLEFQYSRYANYSLFMQKIPKTGFAGTIGTGTTMFGTGTEPVLEGGTGTALGGTGTYFPLHQWYQYHPKGVPVPVSDSSQKWQTSPFFMHFSSIILLYSILHKKLTWNPSKQLHKHF